MNFKALIAAGALLATQSFAIIGIGGHYAPGFGTKMKSAPVLPVAQDALTGTQISLDHGGFSGTMQGFGFKLWVDILPIIDIEATMNFQFGSYDAALYVEDPTGGVQKIDLEIELGGTPFGKANPKFVAMTGDLSITYPITFLPIIRPYIGGGLSYHLNTFVLNQSFTSGIIDDETMTGLTTLAGLTAAAAATQDPAAQAEAENYAKALGQRVQQNVQSQAIDEGLKTSIGGHVLVGLRAKLPIIPIAAYGNFKYYFGGDFPSEVDPGNMTVEVGVGFAI